MSLFHDQLVLVEFFTQSGFGAPWINNLSIKINLRKTAGKQKYIRSIGYASAMCEDTRETIVFVTKVLKLFMTTQLCYFTVIGNLPITFFIMTRCTYVDCVYLMLEHTYVAWSVPQVNSCDGTRNPCTGQSTHPRITCIPVTLAYLHPRKYVIGFICNGGVLNDIALLHIKIQ